jgi:O-antigen ligase
VLYLLWLERRVSRETSPALWIPTLWMLISASRPLATWFVRAGSVPGTNDAGSALDRWVLTALAASAIIVLIRRRTDWRSSMRKHPWLLVLLGYMLLSTFWSQITAIALKRWTRELIVVAMALVVISEANPRQAYASLLRRTAYILLPFSWVLIKYYPALGRVYGKFSGIEMWTGVTGQKNHLGRLCMISALFLVWALYVRWREHSWARRDRYVVWADIFIIFVALYLLKQSDSATSLGTLGLGLMTFFGLSWMRKKRMRVPLTGLAVLVIALLLFGTSTPFLGGSNLASFTSSLGRDTTLTGRTEVWSDVIPMISAQPVLGYGFGSFWTDARRLQYDIPTAHNGYLDILLELGALGLVIYVFWLLSCTRRLGRALTRDYDWAALALSFLVMGLLYNVTESALNSLTEHMTAVTVFTLFVLSYKPVSKCSRRDSIVSFLPEEQIGVATDVDQPEAEVMLRRVYRFGKT